MQLKSSPKIYENYKCDFPENTVARVEKPFKKLDLNLEYKEIEIKSGGFSTYSGFLIIKELGFLTIGKGLTSSLAKASAYAEMAERFSSAHFTFYNINFNLEEYYNIIKDVLEKKFLEGFKEKKELENDEIKLIRNYFDYEFSDKDFNHFKKQGLFEKWVDSYSFIKNKKERVPINFVETISASSGLAAGNTFEEAITQGSCEIFERYAVYKIISDKIECPTVEIDTIEDKRIYKLVEMFKSMNVKVIIKDLTFDNKIPVMGVLFINKNFENDSNQLKKDFYYKMLSAGSHPDLSEAIIRCFTERLQETSKHEFVNRTKCDILYDFWTEKLDKKYQRTKDIYYDYFSDYEFEQDLSFLEKGEKISFKKLKSYKNLDSLDDFHIILKICKENNWNLQVIDYTHNILKFPTVRVLIPPLSSTHHPYVVDFLKIQESKRRFNYFYGIKKFFRFVFEDDEWITKKNSIEEFICNAEEYLSKNLSQYSFAMRMACFYYQINLFYVLAFANLAVNNKKEATEYFRLLYKLNESLPCYDNYFNCLQNHGYNPTLFKSYIEMLESDTQSANNFILNFNPLKPKNELIEYKHIFEVLLKKIRNSYNH